MAFDTRWGATYTPDAFEPFFPGSFLAMADQERVTIVGEDGVRRSLARMALQIVERNDGASDLVLLGIQRRGKELAERIQKEIRRTEGVEVPAGSLDITLYRDDLMTVGPKPVVGESQLPLAGIDDLRVVVVDDVLFTGRTIRAALNELMDWGRPSGIDLCVLVDRGGRELPIQPDIVGRTLPVGPDQRVDVRVPEIDDRLAVELVTKEGA